MPPHMLRKMPGYPMDMGMGMGMPMPMSMEMMMNQQMMGGHMNMPMNMNMGPMMGMPMNMNQMPMGMNMNMNMGPMMGMDQEFLNDPNAKRDYYGERLYGKISSNPYYGDITEYFSKVVGIFLDLEEPVIERLIKDDNYFDIQVRETVRLLAERSNN